MIDDILGGRLDDELDAIDNAINERRKILAKRLTNSLKPGDKVIFNNLASPKYLVGVTATVSSKRAKAQSTVMITLDNTVGRFPQGHEIGCSTVILDKV